MENNVVTEIKEQEVVTKPVFSLDSGDKLFAVFSLIFSIFTSVFGIFGGFSLGYSISSVLMFILFFAYFIKNRKFSFSIFVFGLLSLLNSSIFLMTTNSSVRFFAFVISFLLSLVCYSFIVDYNIKGNKNTLSIFYCAISTMENVSISIRSIFSKENGDKKNFGKALVGFIFAVPVLLIIVPILIASDDAFSGMMKGIFENTFSTLLKAIFGVLISLIIISYGFSLKNDKVAKPKQANFKGIDNVYLISFLSAIGLIYVMYLFSQLAYFFSAFKGFLPDGKITYAQYARKGFFEMCVIAVINIIIVSIAMLISKKKNGNICIGIKFLATFFGGFTLIIISTAISKMVLYISAYGMTVLRLTTSAFMLFLAIVFIGLILKIYLRKINIIKTALITAGCIVFILGALNVNSVCAQYNYYSYKAGKLETIDVNALYELGDEGIPYVIKLTVSDDEDVRSSARFYIARAYIYDYFEDMELKDDFTVEDLKKKRINDSFSYFSIPKNKAYNELYRLIEKNPHFAKICCEIIYPTEEIYY